jgi:hypothetical protein
MGRKYDFKPGQFGWALEECEEQLLIATFHDIESRIPADLKWKVEHLMHFYDNGLGVTFYTMDRINGQLARLRKPVLEFVETDVGEYARSHGRALKAQLRVAIRDKYLALDTAEKLQFVTEARAAVGLLAPPHQTFEQLAAQRRPRVADALGVEEVDKRRTALQMSKTKPKHDDAAIERIERALVLLRLTRKPEISSRIIHTLTPADAFVAAGREGLEQAVIELLVERALDENGGL